MKSAYDKLSLEFNDKKEESIIFASMNAKDPWTQHTTQKLGVHAFPTVVYLKPGQSKIKSVYDGFPRTYESIKTWALQIREKVKKDD